MGKKYIIIIIIKKNKKNKNKNKNISSAKAGPKPSCKRRMGVFGKQYLTRQSTLDSVEPL
jgi:hypothetical protein